MTPRSPAILPNHMSLAGELGPCDLTAVNRAAPNFLSQQHFEFKGWLSLVCIKATEFITRLLCPAPDNSAPVEYVDT